MAASYPCLAEVIDSERYPIEDLAAAPAQALLAELRAMLAERGYCCLPGFLREAPRRELAAALDALTPEAYRGPTETTAYYGKDAEGFPEGHPRRLPVPREMLELAYDQLAPDSALRAIYHAPAFQAFRAAVLGQPQLYCYEDDYQPITVSITPEGAGQNWHFDDTDAVTTLMVQAAEEGGAFECVPDLRSEEDENYDGVLRVLQGAREDVQVIPFEPGTMMIFRGLYSLHQVAAVRGGVSRIVAVFSYDSRPGRRVPEGRNAELFGPRVLTGA